MVETHFREGSCSKVGILYSQAAEDGEKEIQERTGGGDGTGEGWKENAHSGQVRPRGDIWGQLHHSRAGSVTRRLCWAQREGPHICRAWHWIVCVNVQVCVGEYACS